ncbi:MAG: HD domain-containing protein [Erysipelotrichaceae bacterium]|mgnify:CR=1 FL=1|jgi:3'-5' exoribonuclease|nr:HD domain-containing protein [Erysipelotrichaceae bacterium]MCB9499988.1 HD domain-containing protein [Erysipelotrichaceae bacterium]
MIKDLKDGMLATGVYLVKDFNKGVASNGTNFMNIILQDKSGTIEGKIWEVTPEQVSVFECGKPIRIEGRVGSFRDKLQIRIEDIYRVNENDIDVTNLISDSPIPVNELEASLDKYIDSIKQPDLHAIVSTLITENRNKYITHPAAVRNHHEFFHGLLFHSLSMANLVDPIVNNYPTVDRDLLMSGCLIHDIGKLVELSGPVACFYTTEGNLIGHLVIGANMVADVSKKLNITSEYPLLLEHMILSHHAKPEFGAAVVPQTQEALLLSMIDDMDAKMMCLDKVLSDTKKGEQTDRIFALDNRSFYKPKN